MKTHAMTCFRIEAEGELETPFPSLPDAMRDDPSHPEAVIATSLDGVVLAEAIPMSSRKRLRAQYRWQPTTAGLDVLEGGVRGMRAAS